MKKIYLLFGIIFSISASVYGQLVVTQGVTPATLVTTILGNGVTVSNITYTGAAAANGTFTCGAGCNIGFPSGILLTSGSASTAALPNPPSSTGQGQDNGLLTADPQLNTLTTGQTQDVCKLEFDFSVASDSVAFNYIFASDEYSDYANTSCNDVFGFFISGPGIVGQKNIAIVPGTIPPVPMTINNVNNGNAPHGVLPPGPCEYCQYFRDNTVPVAYTTAYDGLTTPMVAGSAVQPCATYHIKLAVADVCDGIFDSGVFLLANSFSSFGAVHILANGIQHTSGDTVYACVGSTITLSVTPAPNYLWNTGATVQSIVVDQALCNQYNGFFNFATVLGTCFTFSQIRLFFVNPTATITPLGPTSLCAGSTVTLQANPGNSYLWSNGATTQSITVGIAGNYVVTVTQSANCSATSAPVQVTVGSASANISGVTSLCNGANTTLTANLGQSYLWSNGLTTQAINVSLANTYTVTVTQAGGCTATASVSVTVNPNPIPAITGTTSVCQGSNAALNATAGYTTYVWNTSATTQSITPGIAGTYTVSVTDANGCTGSATANVTVNALPVPVIAGNTSFCQGSSSILDAGAGYANYLWSTSATTQTITAAASGIYTVTVTNASTCTASTSVNIIVNPLPVPVIAGTTSFCQGNFTVFDAGAGYSNYSWSNGATTQTININSAGSFTVTVTNANGCTGSVSKTTVVNPLPVPNVTGVTSICQGATTTFDAGAGYSSYVWSTGFGGQTLNTGTSGTYTVTVTDINGCTGSDNINLTVNPLPTPAITGISTFCQGASSTLNAGVGYTNYLWSTSATTQTISVNTAGNYVVTVTNGFGCTASTNQNVVVNALPVPVISGVTSFCVGNATTLDAGAGYSNYIWSNGASTQTINVNTAGSFTVTVTNINGCTGSASKTTIVNPLPTPNVTGTTSICQGATTTFDAGAGYSSYVWSTGIGGQTLNTGTSGTYTVTVTDINGCTGSDNINLTVNPLPTPAITGISTFCQGASSTLNAGVGYTNYLWSTSATTQTISVNTAGNYVVTVTNGFGCTASTNQNVVVNALPVPVISGVTSFCVGNATTLDAGAGYSNYIWSNGASTQTINVNTAGSFTVTVTNINGCTGSASKTTIVNPLPTPNVTGTTSICQGATTTFDAGAGYSSYVWSTGIGGQTLNTGTSGTYTVTVTDINGCTGSDNINLTVNPLPTPAITGISTFCQGASSTLNAGVGYTNYLWSTSATTQTISVNTAGNYVVTVTNGFGCTASTNQNVVVNALPVPVISGVTSFCVGNATTLDAGAGYSNYIWSNGASTQTINVNTAGSFTVTVTNINGCTGSASKTTIVNPLPTPNVTGTTSICQGATTTFDAGAGYSSYVWSTGIGGQTLNTGTSGTYTVTVTDINGCTGSDNINLTVNPLPVPAITGNNDFCQGNSSTLNAGAGFINYLWSNAATTQTINVNASGNYIVTVTNGFNCTASTNLLVTVHALPNPVITGGTGICQGTFTILNAGNNYANYSWSTGATTQTINVNTAGNFTVTVTDINGCTNTSSTTMVVNPLPTPVVTGNNIVCQGVSTTFDAGAGYSNYVWSTGWGGQTINTGISGTYTVTVTDVNGCTGSDNISLTVNPLPTPTITGNNVFCQGDNSVLNAGGGFNSYSWSTGSTAQTISVNTSGSYIVTVTNNFGCSASTNILVTVNPLPNPVISGGTGICFGSSTTLDAGNGYSNYEWSIGATTQTVVVTNAGNYTVTVTDNNGCVNSANTAMVVNPLPTPVITGNTAICQGTSTTFDAGTGYNSYVWSTGSGAQILNATIAGIYTVTVTDANGCTGSDNINLVVNALPTPAITGNTVFCQGDNTTLNAGAGYTSYAWSNSSTTQTINTGIAGTYSVTVYDGNGCSASTSVNIVVNPLPTPVISGTSAICSGTTSTLNTGNYSSFLWSTGESTQSISTGDSGNYTVTVTDLNGCINSSPAFNLVVYALPSATISQNSAICIGGSSSFNISFTGTPPFHYMYNDGIQNSALLNSPTSTVTINVTPNDTTTYTLVSVTDLHCSGYVSGSAVVTVNPLPTPAITGNNVICDGTSTTFSVGSYSGYSWSTGENTQSISVNTAGAYGVTVTDGNGCVSSTSQTLIVNETPVAAFSNDTSLTCAEPIIHFLDNSTYPAGSSFLWDFGDGAQSTEENPAHTFTQPGTFPIALTITTSQGCVGTITQNTDIQFYPLPVAEFKTDPAGAASVFNSSVNFIDRSQNAVTWNWNFGDGGNAIEQNPKHYYDEIGKFKIQLTVTNIAGCVSRSEEEILITPFYVPNAFTPNGDGMNDVFFNSGYVMDVASFSMVVWNRWGQKIFNAENVNQSWTGIDKNGNAVAEGSYVYQIKVVTKTNKKYSYEGSVTLLR